MTDSTTETPLMSLPSPTLEQAMKRIEELEDQVLELGLKIQWMEQGRK